MHHVYEVAARTARAFFDLAALDRKLAIARETDGLLADDTRVAEDRYRVGRGVQADVLRASLEKTRLSKEIVRMEGDRRAAAAEFNSLLAQPAETVVAPIEAIDPEESVPDRDAFLARALSESPVLAHYDEEIDRARQEARRARLERRPAWSALGHLWRKGAQGRHGFRDGRSLAALFSSRSAVLASGRGGRDGRSGARRAVRRRAEAARRRRKRSRPARERCEAVRSLSRGDPSAGRDQRPGGAGNRTPSARSTSPRSWPRRSISRPSGPSMPSASRRSAATAPTFRWPRGFLFCPEHPGWSTTMKRNSRIAITLAGAAALLLVGYLAGRSRHSAPSGVSPHASPAPAEASASKRPRLAAARSSTGTTR